MDTCPGMCTFDIKDKTVNVIFVCDRKKVAECTETVGNVGKRELART
jgi:hypothetical protein